MTWGSGAWGSTPWGGVLTSLEDITDEISTVNQRPYPPESVVGVLQEGGVNDLLLPTQFLDETDLYTGHLLLTLTTPPLEVRKVVGYEGRRLRLDRDLPVALYDGSEVVLISTDAWVSDRLYMGIRPSNEKKLVRSSIQAHWSIGGLGFDALNPNLLPGSPSVNHRGVLGAGSGFDVLQLDTTQLVPAEWASADRLKGVRVRLLQGAEVGQVRTIEKNEVGGLATVYPPYRSADLRGTDYEVFSRPQGRIGLTSSEPWGPPIVSTEHAGILLDTTPDPTDSVLVFDDDLRDDYDFKHPVVMDAKLFCHSVDVGASMWAGFGRRVGGEMFSASVVLRDDGDYVTVLIYDKDDVVATTTLDIANMAGRLLHLFFTYLPWRNTLSLSIYQLYPIPRTTLLADFEIPNATDFGFTRPSFGLRATGNCMFFGCPVVGPRLVVQVLAMNVLSKGVTLIRNGEVQGIVDGEILPATPLMTRYERDAVYWTRAWHAKTQGGRRTPSVREVVTLSNGFKVTRSAGSAAPIAYVRTETCLAIEESSGFVYRVRLRIQASSFDGIHSGVSFGVAVGQGGFLRYCHIVFLKHLGLRIGLQIGSGGDAMEDYAFAEVDPTAGESALRAAAWQGREVDLTVAYYPPRNEGEGMFLLYAGSERTPLLAITDTAALTQAFATETDLSPISSPGFFFGLLPKKTEVSVDVPAVDYVCNVEAFHPGIFLNTPVELSYRPWQLSSVGSMELKNAGLASTILISEEGFAYKSLSLVDAGANGFLSPSDGCAVELYLQVLSGRRTDIGSLGVWVGGAVMISDGEERVWAAFGHAGSFGPVIFFPVSPIRGGLFTVDYLQTYLEKITNDPASTAGTYVPFDWTQMTRYRIERVRLESVSRRSRIRLFLNDMFSPVLDMQYEVGRLGDASEPLLETVLGSGVAVGNFSYATRCAMMMGESFISVSRGVDLSLQRLVSAGGRLLEMTSPENASFASLSVDTTEE